MSNPNQNLSADAREAIARTGQIGYYNHNAYPINFSSTVSGRGLTDIEAGAPVLNRQGFLVPYDPDLEAQVALNMLTRIVPNNPNFKKYSKLNETASRQQRVYSAPAGQVSAAPAPTPPAAPAKEVFEQGLPPGVVQQPNGSYLFEGRVFESRSALDIYLDSK